MNKDQICDMNVFASHIYMYVIKQWSEEDLKEVLDLHLKLFPVKYNMNVMRKFLQGSSLALGLWTADGRLIGVVSGSRTWTGFFTTDKNVYLSTFGIDPEYRRKGLGTHLLLVYSHIMYHHFNVGTMTLDMQRINKAAFQFYENFGFKVLEFKPNHYSLEGEGADALFMKLNLEKVANSPLPHDDIVLNDYCQQLMVTQKKLSWYESLFLSA